MIFQQGQALIPSMIAALLPRRRNRPWFIVIVSYGGQPVSLVAGTIRRRTHVAEIQYALTHPDSLRPPYSSTAVRGAGQRALQAFIAHCLTEERIDSIYATARTDVAALVKRKFGFIFFDEL